MDKGDAMNRKVSGRLGRLVGVALVLISLAAAAAKADQGNGNPNDTGNGGQGGHLGWGGGGAPTAPEPGILPMAAAGIVLVGCYAIYRVRRRTARNGSAET